MQAIIQTCLLFVINRAARVWTVISALHTGFRCVLAGSDPCCGVSVPHPSAKALQTGKRARRVQKILVFPFATLALASLSGGAAYASLVRFEIIPSTPLTIQPGEPINFTVIEDYEPYLYQKELPGDPEPAPVFWGSQSWFHGLDIYQAEYIQNLFFATWTSDGQQQAATRSGPDASWQFSVSFPAPGEYAVFAGGGWEGSGRDYYWSASSWRTCIVFICGPWDTDVTAHDYNFPRNGTFPTLSVQVTVVPEPGISLMFAIGAITLILGRLRLQRALGS